MRGTLAVGGCERTKLCVAAPHFHIFESFIRYEIVGDLACLLIRPQLHLAACGDAAVAGSCAKAIHTHAELLCGLNAAFPR